jgi:hypothetical protein
MEQASAEQSKHSLISFFLLPGASSPTVNHLQLQWIMDVSSSSKGRSLVLKGVLETVRSGVAVVAVLHLETCPGVQRPKGSRPDKRHKVQSHQTGNRIAHLHRYIVGTTLQS